MAETHNEESRTVPDEDLVHGWKGIAGALGWSSVNTAMNHAKNHGLPVQKKGGRYFASRRELLAWKEEFENKPKETPGKKTGTILSRPVVSVGLAVAVVAAVVTAFFFMWWRPVEISRIEIDDYKLSALSESGKVLWSVPLPGVETETYAEGSHYFLQDVDDDGLSELIFSVIPRNILEDNSSLICLDWRGKELWRFDYGHELRVGDRLFPRNFESAAVHWIEANQKNYILTLGFHKPFYPTQVALLEPASGGLVGEYLHPGQLVDYALADIDTDPELEILLGGLNNPGLGPGRPVLVGLDLPFPAVVDSFFGKRTAKEVAYLVFPEIDAVGNQSAMSAVRKISIQQDGRIFVGAGINQSNLLIHYFNSELDLVEIRPSDGLVREHDRLFHLGVLDHLFDAERDLPAWEEIQKFDRAPNANRLAARDE